ncbi:hypothetical protein KY330_05385 [Candidatus Woesearchaeota archaeon]|nr:hypothetical protein [Candidatus Woesearchaeota archaeon]
MKNEFGITKKIVLEIMKGVSKRMKAFADLRKEYDIHLSNKNLSEIIGKIMEKVAADVFSKRLGYEVKKALSDRDPDLFFTKINRPLEIKVTSGDSSWVGGEFSQRPFDYLLISWGGEKFDEFFVCFTHLEKTDWKSRMHKKFYGPILKAKVVFKKKRIDFIGNFYVTKKGAVRIKRGKI